MINFVEAVELARKAALEAFRNGEREGLSKALKAVQEHPPSAQRISIIEAIEALIEEVEC